MATQHDKIFKQLLRVFFEDFLRLAAPGALGWLDVSSPELVDKELFDAGPHGSRRELDLLARVRTAGGGPSLVHVEIEARASPGMKERLWHYKNQVQARFQTRVLTLVMYLKRGRPGVCLETWESGLGLDFPGSRYVSFGLMGCSAEEYLGRCEPLAWALAALMDPGSWSRAELKMACLRRIASLRGRIDPFLLVDCVEKYLQLDPPEVAEFEALRSRRENKEVRAVAMTWSETLEIKGAHKLLLHLLGTRFGPLPESVQRKVESISSLDRLTKLAGRLLSAHSLEEMGLA